MRISLEIITKELIYKRGNVDSLDVDSWSGHRN
jgi:hypothetical protein